MARDFAQGVEWTLIRRAQHPTAIYAKCMAAGSGRPVKQKQKRHRPSVPLGFGFGGLQ
jgi:hypothetical protein